MILLELEMHDFKQYRGRHLFAPAETGVVAIIGQNGAGKSTLFEAIEWCLYQKGLTAAEIPPRGSAGAQPSVRLRMATADGANVYEIVRSLRKTGTTIAEIRRIIGESSEQVASGSTTVRKYIASSLIGLTYDAFVATFFTRQKELSFFGALRPTERRREVGRLLGLETIRKAQEVIAEERKVKRSAAETMRNMYLRQSQERDFEAERTVLESDLAARRTESDEFAAKLTDASTRIRDLERQRGELQRDQARQLALKSDFERESGTVKTATARIESADAELIRIGGLIEEAATLEPTVAALEARANRVTALETDQAAARARTTASALVSQANQNLTDVETRIAATIDQLSKEIGYRVDLSAPISDQVAEGLSATAGFDLDIIQRRIDDYSRALDLVAQNAKSAETLLRFQDLLRQREAELAAAQATRTALPASADLERSRIENERRIVERRARIGELDRMIAVFQGLASLETKDTATDACPTCGRPIHGHERAEMMNHVGKLIASHQTERASVVTEIAALDRTLRDIETARNAIEAADTEIAAKMTSVATGRSKIEEQERGISEQTANLNRTISTAGITGDPTQSGLRALEVERQSAQSARDLNQRLGSLQNDLDRAAALVRDRTSDLAQTPEILFRESDLVAARADLQASRDAQSRLSANQREIDRIPTIEAIRLESITERDEASVARTELQTQIEAIVVDEAALTRTDFALSGARQDERRLTAQRNDLNLRIQEIGQAIARIAEDRNRIANLAIQADAATASADDLDRMYTMFNQFEQYVARRVRPQLEDLTSGLVRSITDGKYDGIRLDDDYGITVQDQDGDFYALSEFSGGERDVVSLAARLALSRLIGSQAANPPSFLVLDEIFGSLDRDRRSAVLETLSSLAGSAEAFRQLFVISHVDDVRLSPAFSEVWRVVEGDDGFSSLENMNLSDATEDI